MAILGACGRSEALCDQKCTSLESQARLEGLPQAVSGGPLPEAISRPGSGPTSGARHPPLHARVMNSAVHILKSPHSIQHLKHGDTRRHISSGEPAAQRFSTPECNTLNLCGAFSPLQQLHALRSGR